jgi:pimeloyl-ACP methyl ester carboxylesterase
VDSDGVGRPGRLGPAEYRAATAAPRPADSFVSCWSTVRGLLTHHRAGRPAPAGRTSVVLLHGLAVSHRYLMPTARALLAHHPVLVPDLPGFGLTDKPARAYGVAELADHVAGWLELHGLPPVCALGNSFGAEVAAALAVRAPRRVAALVLVGPTSDPAARSRTGQVARWLRSALHEDLRQAPILARDVRDAGPRRVAATLGHSVRNRIEEDLRRVRVPVLLLRGEHDRIAPPRWLAEAAALVPGSQVATVPGAAHNAITTAGPEVAAATVALLAGRGLGEPVAPGCRPTRDRG